MDMTITITFRNAASEVNKTIIANEIKSALTQGASPITTPEITYSQSAPSVEVTKSNVFRP